MEKNKLNEILGFEPNRALRINILKQVKESGKSIQEVASGYQLPEMFILDDNGKFTYEGEQITPKQFKDKHPFKKFITLSKRNYKPNN